MKIVIASPLFPPETAKSGVYSKKLAQQLSKSNKIKIVTYANEAEAVNGAKIIKIKKRQALPCRLFWYTISLLKESKTADVILVQNSLACIIPAAIINKLSTVNIIVIVTEDEIQKRINQNDLVYKNSKNFSNFNFSKIKIKIIEHLQKTTLNKFQNIICHSDCLEKLLTDNYKINKNKITNIPAPKTKPINA